MSEPAPAAATPGASGAPGQAAGTQQGVQQPGQSGVQGAPAPAAAPGEQGAPPSTGQQPATPAAAAAAAPVAPVTYELRLPEQSVLDQSDIDLVVTKAKAMGWSNDDAQGVLTEMATSLAEQAQKFRAELDADPEIGGTKLAQAQTAAMRVLDRYLPATEVHGQRFRSVMNKSGYGNFAPLVTLLARIGQAMSEDQPGAGAQGQVFTPQRRSQADRLFGDAQGIQRPA